MKAIKIFEVVSGFEAGQCEGLWANSQSELIKFQIVSRKLGFGFTQRHWNFLFHMGSKYIFIPYYGYYKFLFYIVTKAIICLLSKKAYEKQWWVNRFGVIKFGPVIHSSSHIVIPDSSHQYFGWWLIVCQNLVYDFFSSFSMFHLCHLAE